MSITEEKVIPEEALEVPDNFEELLMDWSGYSGKTDAEKRIAIVEKMANMHFGISTAEVSKEVVKRCRAPGKPMPEEISFTAVTDGTTMVYANYDGTSLTAKIEVNKPVVYDPTTGNCVTGIHEDWAAAEYRIVGIALKEHITPNDLDEPVLIPVQLINPPDLKQSIIYRAKRETGTYPTLLDWSEQTGTSPVQDNLWQFQKGVVKYDEDAEPYTNEDIEWLEGEDYVTAANITGHYVPEGSRVQMLQVGERMFCYYHLPSIIVVKLTQDLDSPSASKAQARMEDPSIFSDPALGFSDRLVWVHQDLHLGATGTVGKMKTGVTLACGLRLRGSCWNYIPLAANACIGEDAPV